LGNADMESITKASAVVIRNVLVKFKEDAGWLAAEVERLEATTEAVKAKKGSRESFSWTFWGGREIVERCFPRRNLPKWGRVALELEIGRGLGRPHLFGKLSAILRSTFPKRHF